MAEGEGAMDSLVPVGPSSPQEGWSGAEVVLNREIESYNSSTRIGLVRGRKVIVDDPEGEIRSSLEDDTALLVLAASAGLLVRLSQSVS